MFGLPGWAEILVIAFVGLLIFGKRLPDVARSLGKSVVEFKKGIRDISSEVDNASQRKDKPSALESQPTKPPTETPSPNAAAGAVKNGE
jgi:sec-independent protein translocase protein TatA